MRFATAFRFWPLAVAGLLLLHPAASRAEASGADAVALRAEVRDGALVTGPDLATDTARVREGQRVTITWTADRPTELHLHGYDVSVTATREEPGVMRFDASLPGRFPVEVHGPGGHDVVLYVEVHPR